MELFVLLQLLLSIIIVSKGIEDDYNNNAINRSLIINNNGSGNLPQLFLLGPQKSGSSSLYEYLIKHPQLCSGINKEENYISNDDLYKKGRDGYKKMFVDVKCHNKLQTMYVDASPQFHFMYKVLPRFSQIFTIQEMQNLKFIVVLREPVAQMYSYFEWFTKIAIAEEMAFTEVKTCEEMFNTTGKQTGYEIGYPFYDGGYAKQLKYFLNYFRRDQILILSGDDLFKNTADVMKAIQLFLGIKWDNYWRDHPFPFDDHWSHSRFVGKVYCCKRMLPELGCKFRNISALHFEEYNQELMKMVNVSDKSKFEPPFLGFGSSAYKVPCTNLDPRELYNKKIRDYGYVAC